MATSFYLRQANTGSGKRIASLLRGTGSVDLNGVTDPPAGDQLIARFTSRPLVGFTLSGNVAVNVWAYEDLSTTNSAVRCIVKKMNTSLVLSGNIAVVTSTELGTKSAHVSLTNTTPTSTVVANGEYLVFEVYASPTGGSPATGRIVTLSYDSPAAGATGDSYVTLFENITLKDRFRATT